MARSIFDQTYIGRARARLAAKRARRRRRLRRSPAIRSRPASLQIELQAFEQLELAALPHGRPAPGDQIAASCLKLVGTELHQKIAELAVTVCGPFACASWAATGAAGADVDNGAQVMAKHLAVRSATVYSGASETQRNIIARALGAP
jgi:acyl-CoA dehydrogenase